jgi:hypothetical protein
MRRKNQHEELLYSADQYDAFLAKESVGAAFVFSSLSQISCLNARNRKMVFVFSICGFKISEVLSHERL